MIKPIATFLVLAGMAALGLQLILQSGGSTEHQAGIWLSAVCGLGAIVIPILLVLQTRKK